MKILITGSNGFVGRHLITELLKRGHHVIATSRRGEHDFKLDIRNYSECVETLETFKPDALVNLAGQGMIKTSWVNPRETWETNSLGVVNLLQAAAQISLDLFFITIGSGEEYGLSGTTGVPITEKDLCQPQNPYAVSKFSAGVVAAQLSRAYGIRHIHVRSFNHFGPGQSLGFVISDLASKIVNLEKDKSAAVLKVGNLDASRDFLYIDDVVMAYADLVESSTGQGVYNVCSGKAYKIREILMSLLDYSRINVTIEVDPELLRPLEIPVFIGSSNKIERDLGWFPTVSLEKGLRKTLEWWRNSHSRD